MTVRVWDPIVRIVHWALALAVVLGWATTAALLSGWHEAVGDGAFALVAVRVVWGVLGPRFARFAQFVRSPRATWAYAGDVVRGRARRHLGHNPLGAWMVLSLLACIAGLAATGWLYGTDEFWAIGQSSESTSRWPGRSSSSALSTSPESSSPASSTAKIWSRRCSTAGSANPPRTT